ncbi:MAG: sulfotransferase domain-containing protein [Ktedonobacteraceae bacterium]
MNILKTAKSYTRTSVNFSLQAYRGITHQLRLLPDFLIIGGQRCGTSSLYYYLTEHPSIVPAFTKEPHFFDEHFAKGPAWYRTQFLTSLQKQYVKSVFKKDLLTGEGTPYYILYPHTPKRTFEVVPHVKLIALLRNPVDRAYSQYWIEKQAGFETWSFEDAIKGEQDRLAGEYEKMLQDENYYSESFRHFSYLTRGVYIDQLQNWLRYYPREQLLVLKSEDMYSDPAGVVKQSLEFLGVPTGELKQEFKNYRRPSKKGYRNKVVPPKLDPAMKNYLVEYFKPHNARLSDFLGVDFGWDT